MGELFVIGFVEVVGIYGVDVCYEFILFVVGVEW